MSNKIKKNKTQKTPKKSPMKIIIPIVIVILIIGIILVVITISRKAGFKAYKSQGKQLINEKKYDEAAKKLAEYIKHYPNDEEAYILLVDSLTAERPGDKKEGEPEKGGKAARERNDQAYYVLKKALDLFPNNSKFNLEMGRFYNRTGQHEKAKEQLNLAWEKNQKDPTPKYLLGLIYLYEQDGNKAYEEFKQVLSFDPEVSKENQRAVSLALTYLIEIIGNQGRKDKEALAIISKATKFFPDKENSRAYVALGVYFYKQENWDGSLKRFLIALKKEPKKEAWANLPVAEIHERNGDKKKALKYYRQFLDAYGPPKKLTVEEVGRAAIYKGIKMNELDIVGIKEKIEELEREID